MVLKSALSVTNICVKNNCKTHPNAALETTGNCAVEFVYIFPANDKDKRRWIGGVICTDVVSPSKNLHNHTVELSLSHKLSSIVTSAIQRSIDENPYLTTRQIACGQGIGWFSRHGRNQL